MADSETYQAMSLPRRRYGCQHPSRAFRRDLRVFLRVLRGELVNPLLLPCRLALRGLQFDGAAGEERIRSFVDGELVEIGDVGADELVELLQVSLQFFADLAEFLLQHLIRG